MKIVITLRMLRAVQGFKCLYCRKETILRSFEKQPREDCHASYEHLLPRSEGGSDEPANLRCACFLCNRLRGNKNLHWFLEYMGKIRNNPDLISRWHQLLEHERKEIFADCEVVYQNWLKKREKTMAQALRR